MRCLGSLCWLTPGTLCSSGRRTRPSDRRTVVSVPGYSTHALWWKITWCYACGKYKNTSVPIGGGNMALSKELLDILVCPQCKGDLELTEKQDGLICHACK